MTTPHENEALLAAEYDALHAAALADFNAIPANHLAAINQGRLEFERNLAVAMKTKSWQEIIGEMKG